MKNQFDDAIEQLKVRIAEMEAEAIDLKRAVNSLYKTSGQPPLYAETELVLKGFSGLGGVKPAQFYGKSPITAAREYLEMRGDPVELDEILEALRKGSFDFDAQGWKNEVMHLKNLSISLGKNSQMFHRLPNGMMGLLKWFPNVKAKKAGKDVDKTETEADINPEAESNTESEAEANDTDKPSEATASVAAFISKTLEKKLSNLDYTEQDIYTMKPAYATHLVENQIAKEDAADDLAAAAEA